jgi:hypothetical protein
MGPTYRVSDMHFVFFSCRMYHAHNYWRLAEYQRPFNPPNPSKTPVLVRSVTYAGEPYHPVAQKRTIVVPISNLGLANEEAFHNLKVIAGSRWTLEVPKDSGLPQSRHEPVYDSPSTTASTSGTGNTNVDSHGYIKISCENFPDGTMNLKWCMDVLRRLVKEANVSVMFSDNPSQLNYSGLLGKEYIVISWGLFQGHPASHKASRFSFEGTWNRWKQLES